MHAIRQLSKKHQFQMLWTEDAGIFTEEELDKYDVVVFLNNDGDILNLAQQQAFKQVHRLGFLDWVVSMGVHRQRQSHKIAL